MLTVGVDIGSSAVKVAVMRHAAARCADAERQMVTLLVDRYRRRTPAGVVGDAVASALRDARIVPGDVGYLATTGEGELAPRRDGHFYGMTTHARGALFLEPRTRSVLDCGALHARAIRIDPKGRVLAYRMTSQCASGTGQFLENIARYLGVSLTDIGPMSLASTSAETVSSICAVLAETDVINMVARGVEAPAILNGIHRSVAGRLAKLLKSCRVEGPVTVTGGLAADVGLVGSLRQQLGGTGGGLEVVAPEQATFAGAVGAAIWGAHRSVVVQRSPTEVANVHA
jgi:benzoyl-CoA reductase subunit D